MANIPLAMPKTRWVKFNGDQRIKNAANRAAEAAGWNPKIVDLSKRMKAIDYAFRGSEPTHFKVILYKDSKHMRDLPSNAPRAVKAIYRKDVLLAIDRATDYSVVAGMWSTAEDAWKNYSKSAPSHGQS